MSEEGATCPICQKSADPYGDDQVGCGVNGDRIYRHDSVGDTIFSAAQSAALAPRKEAPSVIPGSSSCLADVYLPNWKRGQPAALDIHVISTMQQQILVGVPPPQDTPCRWARRGRWPPMQVPAWWLVSLSYPWLWSRWEAGVTRPFRP